ncbi:MAG: hypothetical protein CFE21_05880 [Bacteroidetes bacterium B1(2017)]|nr:MAG: hypothetical protein CFE21_05880 [Bacteroidetes bacterium B1(2017)]
MKAKNLIGLCLLVVFISSCSKSVQTETQTNRSFNKKAGCACIPNYKNPNCGDCISKILMYGETEANYEAHWNFCKSDDPNNNPCPGSGFISKAKFCYAQPSPSVPNDCSLYLEIDDLPSCIKCVTSLPICVRLKGVCSTKNNKDFEVSFSNEDPDFVVTVSYEYSISKDPKLTVCCRKSVPNFPNLFYNYCCDADIIYIP